MSYNSFLFFCPKPLQSMVLFLSYNTSQFGLAVFQVFSSHMCVLCAIYIVQCRSLECQGWKSWQGSSNESQTIDSQAELQPMAPFCLASSKTFLSMNACQASTCPLVCHDCLPVSLVTRLIVCASRPTAFQFLAGETKAWRGSDLSKVNSWVADPGIAA